MIDVNQIAHMVHAEVTRAIAERLGWHFVCADGRVYFCNATQSVKYHYSRVEQYEPDAAWQQVMKYPPISQDMRWAYDDGAIWRLLCQIVDESRAPAAPGQMATITSIEKLPSGVYFSVYRPFGKQERLYHSDGTDPLALSRLALIALLYRDGHRESID